MKVRIIYICGGCLNCPWVWEVYDLIRDGRESASGSCLQALLGVPICAHAFRRLLGIGQGRYEKLKRPVQERRPVPHDGRYVSRANEFKTPSKSRQLVVEYLEELYHTVAEVLPESHGSLSKQGQAPPKPMRFRRHRGRAPKIGKWSRARNGDKSNAKLRLLPPGSYSDYLNILTARHPDVKISHKLFASAL